LGDDSGEIEEGMKEEHMTDIGSNPMVVGILSV